MINTLTFTDESLEKSVRRRAEYDDSQPGALMLSVPKRTGGRINLSLLENARSNIEQDEYQENTLLRVRPLAEISNNLPVRSGGLTFHTGKAVGMLRPGYLYVFRGERLWRELEIDNLGLMSDVDLESLRQAEPCTQDNSAGARVSEGEWLSDILVPVLLQGRAVINEIRVAYSEVQWDWRYICALEEDAEARRIRTSGIDHAWPAAMVDELTFENGYPASNIEHVQKLRSRDLGIELMLENPGDFVPEFEMPEQDELCIRLTQRLKKISEDHGPGSTVVDLRVQPESDSLENLRGQKGLVCVSIPDPLFRLRHSLSQLHLALHFLDAVDTSIQKKPMVHSAMLIRQAVFDPLTLDGEHSLQKYADVIDKQKLDEVLETDEKNRAIATIERHVSQLQELMRSRLLDSVLNDYRQCSDLAICEGYLLIADKLNLLQQIPGVLRANGVTSDEGLLESLKRWLFDGDFLASWAPRSQASGQAGTPAQKDTAFSFLQALTRDQTEITEAMLDRLNLQSLAYLEKQLQQRQNETNRMVKGVSDGGKVAGLVARSIEEWSTSVLAVCKRLIEAGEVKQVEIQRVMQSAASNFVLADPALAGITVVSRGAVETSGTILGIRGEGLQRGLTNFDRTEGVLTRRNDYLYADLMASSDELVGSTSPARAADELETAIQKAAGHTMIFFAPAGYSEAKKLSLIKVDFAKRASRVVDGPAVSRGLVALAAFNVFLEFRAALIANRATNGNVPNAVTKALAGATTELTAAALKLSIVLNEHNLSGGQATKAYRLAVRPLFDVKNWFFIGNRLQALGVQTLIRTVGLASFVAGAVAVGLSYWDMRLSLANKDFDSASGHAVAMAGGLVFLSSPLMHTLLAIPGWGWAAFGMALIVGGGIYAGHAQDDAFEQLLKRGPWGTIPDGQPGALQDKNYYSQLLSLLSPISVTAERYADVEPDPALAHPDYTPAPDDYVVTVRMSFSSRLRLFRDRQPELPKQPFNLVVQEVAYASSTMETYNMAGEVETLRLSHTTPLRKVVARQSLPAQSSVRFLIKRELRDQTYAGFGYQESISTAVRVGLQVVIDTELGPTVFPAPVFEDFEPFDLARHGSPPAKERSVTDPFSQPASPYWFFTEVAT